MNKGILGLIGGAAVLGIGAYLYFKKDDNNVEETTVVDVESDIDIVDVPEEVVNLDGGIIVDGVITPHGYDYQTTEDVVVEVADDVERVIVHTVTDGRGWYIESGWQRNGDCVGGLIRLTDEMGNSLETCYKVDSVVDMFMAATADDVGNIYAVGMSYTEHHPESTGLIIRFTPDLKMVHLRRFDSKYLDFQKISIEDNSITIVGNCTIDDTSDGICVVRLTESLGIIDTDCYKPGK